MRVSEQALSLDWRGVICMLGDSERLFCPEGTSSAIGIEKKHRLGRIRYLVIDANDISRAGLASILNSQGEIVEQHADYSIIHRIDLKNTLLLIAVNDEKLPLLKTLLEEKGPVMQGKILCISSDPSIEQWQIISRLGVQGYCSNAISLDNLMLAINAVQKGATFICPLIHEKLGKLSRDRSIGDELSPREMDVVVQLVKGGSNQQIAQQLHISTETVKAHVKSILAKLGVKDRTQAVLKALKHGLVEQYN